MQVSTGSKIGDRKWPWAHNSHHFALFNRIRQVWGHQVRKSECFPARFSGGTVYSNELEERTMELGKRK